jgi:hypothetical protein
MQHNGFCNHCEWVAADALSGVGKVLGTLHEPDLLARQLRLHVGLALDPTEARRNPLGILVRSLVTQYAWHASQRRVGGCHESESHVPGRIGVPGKRKIGS